MNQLTCEIVDWIFLINFYYLLLLEYKYTIIFLNSMDFLYLLYLINDYYYVLYFMNVKQKQISHEFLFQVYEICNHQLIV